VIRDILCQSERIFGDELRQNVSYDCEGCSSSVYVFAERITFLQAAQPSPHGRKRHSEIFETAPQMSANCLAPLFLWQEKLNDKALFPFIHQFILTLCRESCCKKQTVLTDCPIYLRTANINIEKK
jgi:hypothetical protein